MEIRIQNATKYIKGALILDDVSLELHQKIVHCRSAVDLEHLYILSCISSHC